MQQDDVFQFYASRLLQQAQLYGVFAIPIYQSYTDVVFLSDWQGLYFIAAVAVSSLKNRKAETPTVWPPGVYRRIDICPGDRPALWVGDTSDECNRWSKGDIHGYGVVIVQVVYFYGSGKVALTVSSKEGPIPAVVIFICDSDVEMGNLRGFPIGSRYVPG